MFKWITLLIGIGFLAGCVPEGLIDPETGEPVVCHPVGSFDALVVKVRSGETLPENLMVSINDGQSKASETCLFGYEGGALSVSEDRKEITMVFPLVGQLDEFYFAGASKAPIEDYADFRFFTKESCLVEEEPLHERRNIAINWQTKSIGDVRCKNNGTSGFAQFRYNP